MSLLLAAYVGESTGLKAIATLIWGLLWAKDDDVEVPSILF